MTHIRPGDPNDATAIAHVHVAAWKTAYRGIVSDEFLEGLSVEQRSKKWQENLQESNQCTYVAEDATGEVIGFSNGGPELKGRDDFRGEVYAIYLLDEWRGSGVGRKLFRAVGAALVNAGMDSMLVWVLEENPYRPFYERLGGQFLGRETVEIGGRKLEQVAYGWRDLSVAMEKKSW